MEQSRLYTATSVPQNDFRITTFSIFPKLAMFISSKTHQRCGGTQVYRRFIATILEFISFGSSRVLLTPLGHTYPSTQTQTFHFEAHLMVIVLHIMGGGAPRIPQPPVTSGTRTKHHATNPNGHHTIGWLSIALLEML